MKKKSKLIGVLLLLLVFFGNYINKNYISNNNGYNNSEPVISDVADTLKIHYLNVGQGDSTFIELPNDETILIDAGEADQGTVITEYIKKLGYNKINYLIGTHPHSDHIGGMSYIIDNFEISNIYMPKVSSNTKTYENLLTNILEHDLSITSSNNGTVLLNTSNLKAEFIAPNSDKYSSLNNYSLVLKLNYYNRAFLFMGDAEVVSEDEIVGDLQADIIKIGHHGSDTSSGLNFLNRVKPKYAIISVGIDNKYNHPNDIVINRLSDLNVTVYRTDLNNNIIAITDGNNLEVKPNM